MKRVLIAFAGLAVLAASFVACSRGGDETKASQNYLTIKGSDTMVHLVSTWAEDYMSAHPGVEISVTGGGSGTGIAALLNGTTDITAASRDMKESEFERATSLGITPVETVVARDGIAVVVNPSNTVTDLTLDQLMAIYTGEVTNWNQVGGPDRDILVLSRESNSGTYVFFQEHVLQKQDYTVNARLMPATSSVIQSVSEDAGAIGYVGLGYAEDSAGKVKVVNVRKNADSEPVAPSVATVNSGEYSIARPLYFYTNGEPTGLAAQFATYALSAEGQHVVQETGYVPIH